jgi:arsenical pump membrane protein
VANAASFVFPISNPANIVVFRELPALLPWLRAFAVPSIVAIVCTYGALWALHAKVLRYTHAVMPAPVTLSRSGKLTALTVGVSALLLVVCAAFGWPIGRAAFVLGAIALAVLAVAGSSSPRAVLRDSPWSIIPMVAGLFVIVAALDRTGAVSAAAAFLHIAAGLGHPAGTLLAGGVVTVAANVFNNLPVGVLARFAVHLPNVPTNLSHASLVGVDLGPNMSVTGSLATLLWLIALRREGVVITPWQFSKAGIAVTLPALLFALLTVR